MSLLTIIKNDFKFFINKELIDEFEELKNEIYYKLKLWQFDLHKEDISIVMEYQLCVGEFAVYSIFIKGMPYLWLNDLNEIKNYRGWHVSPYAQGMKLSCSSNRVKSQTTRALQNKDSGILK